MLKYKGLKNEESSPVWIKNPNIQTDANQSSPVGQYVVIVNNGIAKNYDVTFTKGILTINKAALTISASNKSRLYYEENPTLTCSFSGFVNGDDASILSAAPKLFTTALINSSVGIYPISVNGAEAKNYSITYVAGTLEIEKRSLNASTENYTRAYNEENPTFKVNYSGFVNGETEKVLLSKPIVSTVATKNSDVGSYDITLSGGIAENYDFTYDKGKLTIEKAYQTITWNQDLSKVTQYSQVELRAQVSSGLPVTYTLSNNTVCNLNNIGSKTYLDFFHYGKVVIVAQNEGNKNYWPSLKSYKELNVDEPTGIKATTNTNRYSGKISVKNGQIIINELARGSTVSICTLSGVTLYSGTDSNIKVPAGIYIVKIGNSVAKVLVR